MRGDVILCIHIHTCQRTKDNLKVERKAHGNRWQRPSGLVLRKVASVVRNNSNYRLCDGEVTQCGIRNPVRVRKMS